jgi:hypothetical protein
MHGYRKDAHVPMKPYNVAIQGETASKHVQSRKHLRRYFYSILNLAWELVSPCKSTPALVPPACKSAPLCLLKECPAPLCPLKECPLVRVLAPLCPMHVIVLFGTSVYSRVLYIVRRYTLHTRHTSRGLDAQQLN